MASVLLDSTATRAACLTPPTVGGIAVIQVVGEGAVQVLANHLRKVSKADEADSADKAEKAGKAGTPLDLLKMSDSELRLCRIVENDEVLDDVVVCIRKTNSGEFVIDLSMHGGPRIVQRVLLMLQREGVAIVEPQTFIRQTWSVRTSLHADATEALLQAKTRRVAIWLARLPDVLVGRFEQICDWISQGQVVEAREDLAQLLAAGGCARLLMHGVRVVLLGPPNSGKSTLANSLSEREQAVVSQLPGTTRDWTEHPAAISGVPLTIVDTAGVRATDDAIEMEAISRTLGQMRQADLILHVLDGSVVEDQGNLLPFLPRRAGPSAARWSTGSRTSRLATSVNKLTQSLREDISPNLSRPVPCLVVRNKADLFLQSPPVESAPMPLESETCISAVRGWGLDQLRARMLEAVGLPDGGDWPVAPFTAGQLEACRRAHRALDADADDRMLATRLLQYLPIS